MDIAYTLPGNVVVYSFSLVLAVGTAIGLAYVAGKADNVVRVAHLNAGLWALAGALLGARILYVALHWPYFQLRLAQVFAVNRGGLSWVGALVGAIAALWLVARFQGNWFADLADLLIPLIAAVTISSWLGCWLSGCAYGYPSNAWWALPAVDEVGVVSNRIPTQLIASLLTALVLWLIYSNHVPVRFSGQTASLFLFGFSLIYFALTYLRADPIPVSIGLRWDAWGALGFGAIGLAGYLKLIPVNP